MFITVRYGDDKKAIFNPNCKVFALLACIKEKCDCDKDDVVDLSDLKGIRKNLDAKLSDYGIKYMEEREVVILVRIERFPGALNETCVPSLHELQGNKEFLDNLNKDMIVKPNSELDGSLGLPKPTQGSRRGSVNVRTQKMNKLFVGKRRVSRSQSLAVPSGTNLLTPSRKPRL